MPWNRIGKYEIRPEAGPHGTIYVLINTETGEHEKGHWDLMTAAMLEAARLELIN